MSGWDIGRVYAAQEVKLDRGDEERDGYDEELTVSRARAAYRGFIRNYREQNLYIYREQLLQNYSKGDTTLTIDLQHLSQYQPRLADALVTRPNEFIPAFEDAAKEALAVSIAATEVDEEIPSIQIILEAPTLPRTDIRSIAATHVNRLVCVPGIAISATKTRPKAVVINIKCTTCGLVKRLPCSPAFGAVQIPRRCEGLNRTDNPTGNPVPSEVDCGVDPYVIVPDQCAYVDQQTLKLQEVPDSVPTGEMPRHVIVSVERGLADRVSPGTRVSVIGVVSVFTSSKGQAGTSGVAVRTPYVRAVGLMVHDEGSGRAQDQFTPEEEEAFKTMARDPAIYEKMWKSVAPSISGSYTDDIKKAITCLLMGGSRKRLPDGMRLRGDINVLLLGDPSTAKSQFLKFVERAAPVGVYTSGKGSSAAGLTASVVRDARGEFFLEGGAMVRADGGVVCIDEFDKMRPEDRVAIHEAMEQQTISVAKAGITTILNSRAAVLAAANPVHGRYDDMKSAAENIDFLPTILSRFDLIFIVRDERDEARDLAIARHVMSVHINAEVSEEGDSDVGIPLTAMKRFISYCRTKCAPRLNSEAVDTLSNMYVQIREDSRNRGAAADAVIPITVRQLEALIRISESLAKITLSPDVGPHHVEEAMRLFRVSTLHAASSGLVEGVSGEDLNAVRNIERMIENQLSIGSSFESGELIQRIQSRASCTEDQVRHAIFIMVKRGQLRVINEGRRIRRMM